jgi:hypothetical protein
VEEPCPDGTGDRDRVFPLYFGFSSLFNVMYQYRMDSSRAREKWDSRKGMKLFVFMGNKLVGFELLVFFSKFELLVSIFFLSAQQCPVAHH